MCGDNEEKEGMKQNFKETGKGSRVRLVVAVGMTLVMPARLGGVIFCSNVRQLGCRPREES